MVGKSFQIAVLGTLLAIILFFAAMVDLRDFTTEKDDLIICQFGNTKTEFIMTVAACRDDGGIVYRVQ